MFQKHITKIPEIPNHSFMTPPKPPYVTFDTPETGKLTIKPPSTFTFTIWVPYIKHHINGTYIS
jgi:hypothetical protein